MWSYLDRNFYEDRDIRLSKWTYKTKIAIETSYRCPATKVWHIDVFIKELFTNCSPSILPQKWIPREKPGEGGIESQASMKKQFDSHSERLQKQLSIAAELTQTTPAWNFQKIIT